MNQTLSHSATHKLTRYRRLRVLSRRIRPALWIFLVVLLLGGGVWALRADAPNTLWARGVDWLIDQSAGLGLVVHDVYISGQTMLDDTTLQNTLTVKQGMPILAIDLPGMKRDIESLGWVKEVVIERKLPSTLHIRIIERTPIAVWQHQKQLSLIDKEGAVIEEGVREEYMRLPILVGEDAHLHAATLFDFLQHEPSLFERVSSVIRIGGRRWNVRLLGGIEIKLPEENPEEAWRRLAILQKEQHILDRHMQVLDLRIPGRLFFEAEGSQ